MSIADGLRPHPSFVPPPRTTRDLRSRDAEASTAATSSADAGSTSSRGVTPSMSAGPTGPLLRSPANCISEPLGESRLLEWMRVIRSGHLAAESRRREHFARIAQPLRIEGAPYGKHDVQIVVREHLRHVVGFVRADAVLAGERSARVDAVLEDLGSHLRGEVGLAGNAL